MLTKTAFLRYWLPALLWASLIGLFSTALFEAQTTGRLFRAILFASGVNLAHLGSRKQPA